ncbi:aspartic proteinase NANA, chloroplast-like [Pistacia vera]|uniref:aspartic proteinase NANA, chloroplast-like n=1 Tax=Pistacia vera TaxID=55513 RepID=UPI001263E076|nr:aspartic proteinase NANA, chloroplast-like [Pistacia vera]
MTTAISFPFLILFFLCNNAFLPKAVAISSTSPPHEFARFELIHRHSSLLAERTDKAFQPPENPLERIKELVHSDIARLQRLSHRLSLRRKIAEVPKDNSSSISLPLRSAADAGVGQFFVTINVGTPPKSFALITDTGSDLTWMKCKLGKCSSCKKGFKDPPGNFFQADLSSSFKSIPCNSDTCIRDLADLFSLTICPTPSTPCSYQYNYIDGSVANGFFGNEVLSFGMDNRKMVKMHDALIGCTESSEGIRGLDGVLGLGYNNNSFAVKAARMFNQKFSYCLVDHLSPSTKVSYLLFGNNPHRSTRMQYTELLLKALDESYGVNVSGISIGGTKLDIHPAIFDANADGGMLLDTGATLTFLAMPAYKPVMKALTAPLQKFKKMDVNVPALEFCFSSAGYNESIVPELVWHFSDGATFVPPKKSYIIDTAPGIKCVGLASAPFPGASIMGSIMQQNHLWEFDLANRKVGFGLSPCL